MLGMVPLDIHMSDTYFIVAHIHFVLFGGSVFTIMAGIYHWFPKMTGRMYDERLGRLHFWITFVAMNLTFFPMHWIGQLGMNRRVADYGPLNELHPQMHAWNFFISVSAFAMGVGFIVFFYNMVNSWARGPHAPGNPWRAHT